MSLDLLAAYTRRYIESKSRYNEKIIEPEKKIEPLAKPFITIEDIFNDAMPQVESDNFYSFSFVGSQGKGKSYTASLLGTYAEQRDFLVICGKAEEILPNKDAWVEQVKELIRENGTIYLCLILEDFSYSLGTISNKKQSEFKHFVGDIRHVFEKVLGKIKILMIYISHRLHSLPPMLRNSGTWIFASMLPEDRADAIKLIPKQKEERDRLEILYKFLQDVATEGPKHESISFKLGEANYQFRWGKDGSPGDGRLYMIFHGGKLKILQSKAIENMIDIEDRRLLIVSTPEKTDKERYEEIKQAAEKLFPIPNKG